MADYPTPAARQLKHAQRELRSQMVHGGATWQSSANRKQLQDANKLLMDVIPLIINIMMANPDTLWGDAIYPFREHG